VTLPRIADDSRRLLYEIEAEADRLTAAGDDVIRQIGHRIGDHVLSLRRLADELGRREWDRGSG
jgi:hypothetical protein